MRTTLVVSFWLIACAALGTVSLVDGLLLRVIADVSLLGLLGAYVTLPFLVPRTIGRRQGALSLAAGQ